MKALTNQQRAALRKLQQPRIVIAGLLALAAIAGAAVKLGFDAVFDVGITVLLASLLLALVRGA